MPPATDSSSTTARAEPSRAYHISEPSMSDTEAQAPPAEEPAAAEEAAAEPPAAAEDAPAAVAADDGGASGTSEASLDIYNYNIFFLWNKKDVSI